MLLKSNSFVGQATLWISRRYVPADVARFSAACQALAFESRDQPIPLPDLDLAGAVLDKTCPGDRLFIALRLDPVGEADAPVSTEAIESILLRGHDGAPKYQRELSSYSRAPPAEGIGQRLGYPTLVLAIHLIRRLQEHQTSGAWLMRWPTSFLPDVRH